MDIINVIKNIRLVKGAIKDNNNHRKRNTRTISGTYWVRETIKLIKQWRISSRTERILMR